MPGEWTDVCGVVKHPHSCDKWKVRLHGAFTILRETLGLRETQVAMRCGTWTLLAISLTSHEENTSFASSKKGPIHTRLARKRQI